MQALARKQLRLAPGLAFPLDAITRTFGVFGQRGSGKSTTGAVLVEQAVRAGGRSVVLDPTGVWHGLIHQGTEQGLTGVVLGGEQSDAPLDPGAGALVAEFVINSDYPLVVLDMKLLRKHQRVRFAMDFLEALYHDNREPLLVVFDEAAQFAPQMAREGGDTMRLLGAVEDLVKLGRSRGLGAVMIEQRIATLNANVREQIETLISHRLVGPLDRKALSQWIAAQGEPERESEALALIPKLQRGQALVWSPAFIEFFGVVDVNNATTFDSRATPKVGQRIKKPGKRAPVDLETLQERMAASIAEAEAKDPKKLRAEVAKLKRELQEQSISHERTIEYANNLNLWVTELEQLTGETAVEEVLAVYMLAKRNVGFSVDLVDEVRALAAEQVPAIGPELITKIVRDVEAWEAEHSQVVQEKLAALLDEVLAVHKICPVGPSRLRGTSQRHAQGAPEKQTEAAAHRPVDVGGIRPRPPRRVAIAPGANHPDRSVRTGPKAAPDTSATGGANLYPTGPEQRILDALAWYAALGIATPTKLQVGLVAGYRAGGGYFSNLVGGMRTKGWIDYPVAGAVLLIEAGAVYAHETDLPKTEEAFQRHALALVSGPQRKILSILLDVWPEALRRPELGERAGFDAGGGYFANIVGNLRTLGFVAYPNRGEVRAADVLFPEGM